MPSKAILLSGAAYYFIKIASGFKIDWKKGGRFL